MIHPVGRGKKSRCCCTSSSSTTGARCWCSPAPNSAPTMWRVPHQNGVSAMALHGNKSQSARTQALAGFKSGEIRALVATDIAARGIDIDDLPRRQLRDSQRVRGLRSPHRPHGPGRHHWRSSQPRLHGRGRLHDGHRALYQAANSRPGHLKALALSQAKRPSPSPWAARRSGAVQANHRAAK